MCTHVSFCVFLWEQTLTAELVNRNYPAFSKLEPCRCLHTSSKKKKKLDSPMIVFICFAGFVETQIAGPDSLFIIRRSVRGFHYRYCLQKEITSWRALSSTSFHILSVVFFTFQKQLPRERLDSKPLLDSFKHSFIYFFSLFTKKCFAESHVHSFMSAKCARRLRCRVERHHGARAND